MSTVSVEWDAKQLRALRANRVMPAVARAVRRAGQTALRDMRSEASKRIRQRKRLKAAIIARALRLTSKGSSLEDMEWSLDVAGKPVPLGAYPARQTRRGVSVEVNKGKRTLVAGAFIATLRSGHKGVFRRVGRERLPIRELLGSRPVDALLHKGEPEAVLARGKRSLSATLDRLLKAELGKTS